ncbi:MAG: PSD1 and planctomycete cytochrome C domain-containing protein [Planctomycetota bacterium]|nr:PSD1 and planctomycete cytochrome C domain-containing protein [Planctomycetota bacterium]
MFTFSNLGILVCSVFAAEVDVEFDRDVVPILRRHCLKCHHSKAGKGGFRIDSVEGLFTSGNHGIPVVAGTPEISHLISRVTSDDVHKRMPPDGTGLSEFEINVLTRWIKQGASVSQEPWFGSAGSGLWSVQPLVIPEVPPHSNWGNNEIDGFILQSLNQVGLSPSPDSDRRTWIRRLYLVILGLPPDPEEVEAFIQDRSPDAVERQIDSVLQSPHYGERWAQHWLDCVRFAESTGYEVNKEIESAYYYRDYVIQALNEDIPYDRFVQEQLAGDTSGADAATGFLVAGPHDGNLSPDPLLTAMQMQDSWDEMIKSTSAVFLGLTVGCARCHDHKFDPISQKDYYSLQAVFSGVRHGKRRLRGVQDDQMQNRADMLEPRRDAAYKNLTAIKEGLSLKDAIDFREYEERFDPIQAKGIRIRIEATHDGGAVQLDDIEVWSTAKDDTPSVNVAHRDLGAWAESSPTIAANQGKTAETLLDGQRQLFLYFNAVSQSGVWVNIYFKQPFEVNRIVVKPRGQSVPVDYRMDVKTPDGRWIEIVDSRDRMIHMHDQRTVDQVELNGVDPSQTAALVEANQAARNLNTQYKSLRSGYQVDIGSFEESPATYILRGGDPFQKGRQVEPNIPQILGDLNLPVTASEQERRARLARVITDPSNPLIARVIVNRIWQYHFGTGIVDTPSDFGFNGSYPTHPGLLDWLATYLLDQRWSLKSVHKKILQSATFGQASFTHEAGLKKDAGVRLLWRFPPRRLEAEVLRDSILATSGKLNLKRYGPGFSFFKTSENAFVRRVTRETFDESGWRRMIYGKKIRLETPGIFGAFDCPDASQMTPKRFQSTTSVQALSLFNSQFVSRQAHFTAALIQSQIPKDADTSERVNAAVYRLLGRPASDREQELLKPVVRDQGLAPLCRLLFNSNEFVFVN